MYDASRFRKAAILALFAFIVPALLYASPAAAQEQTAARKVGRGMAGITLGFMEIPGNMVEQGRTNGPVPGVTLGLALGLGKFVARELVGVYELLTAPFEVPAGFQPIMQPEFPWQYFESARSGTHGFAGTALAAEANAVASVNGAALSRRNDALIVEFPKQLRFESGSAALSSDAKARLAALADVLQEYPDLQVTIRGYTDITGDQALNLRLSNQRAEAVRRYLVSQGVASNRVVSSGFGEADPIADNSTAKGRQRNRRVEIEMRAPGTMVSGGSS